MTNVAHVTPSDLGVRTEHLDKLYYQGEKPKSTLKTFQSGMVSGAGFATGASLISLVAFKIFEAMNKAKVAAKPLCIIQPKAQETEKRKDYSGIANMITGIGFIGIGTLVSLKSQKVGNTLIAIGMGMMGNDPTATKETPKETILAL